jgi:hypothetical protein
MRPASDREAFHLYPRDEPLCVSEAARRISAYDRARPIPRGIGEASDAMASGINPRSPIIRCLGSGVI